MSSIGGKVPWPIIGALFALGLGVLLYPLWGNLVNEYLNARTVREYERVVEETSGPGTEEAWSAAEDYNARHRVNVAADPFGGNAPTAEDKEYESLLSVTPDGASGVMGSLEVPKISQLLAIYHGTSSVALEKGVGHVQGTSLPVGGPSTHCVIAGHRGLASALIFTDLDQMRVGDQFYLHTLGRHLAYEVEDVSVVNPENLSVVAIRDGEDLASLITCTPYGVNTQRLVIRGHRVPYVPHDNMSLANALAVFSPVALAAIAVVCGIVITLAIVLLRRWRSRIGKEES